MKIIILLALLVILVSLGLALFNMTKKNKKNRKMLYYLTIRITFSVILFIILLISFKLGLIRPTNSLL